MPTSTRCYWALLNRFLSDQGHCASCRKKWGLSATDVPFWQTPNDVNHYVTYCQQLGLPSFHFPNPERGSGAEPPAEGRPGVSPPEHVWNSICHLVHFDAVWWQLGLFVGRRTRYICNFAIKTEPICQLQCPHE